jgi:superoxide dismutase, Cu-Zn family
MRSTSPILAGLLGVLMLAGCSATTATLPSLPASLPRNVQVTETFMSGFGPAVTYDQRLVPPGARATVSSRSGGGITTVVLVVSGLEPGRRYGAHVHTDPCGRAAADAGPHFQNVVDPVQPSVDPRYANPENEIWLDFATDQGGAASVENTVAWEIPADRRPQSVVVDAGPSALERGSAGAAGSRAACVTVQF